MSTSFTGNYCSFKDKMCLTKQEATESIRSLAKSGGGSLEKHQCKHCGAWHLAHKMKKGWLKGKKYGAMKKARGK